MRIIVFGANGRQVVEGVKAKIARMQPSLPFGVHIDAFYDRADLVNRTIRTVATNLAEGALFVVALFFTPLFEVLSSTVSVQSTAAGAASRFWR